jgi:hypothetical protein
MQWLIDIMIMELLIAPRPSTMTRYSSHIKLHLYSPYHYTVNITVDPGLQITIKGLFSNVKESNEAKVASVKDSHVKHGV